MSDVKAEFQASMQKVVELERLNEDTKSKKAILDNKKVNNQLKALQQNEKELELAQSASFGPLSAEQISKLQQENIDYMEAAKNKMRFMVPSFEDVVPFFRKNLVLIGGKTGGGKSTVVANIVYSVVTQKNKQTGTARKALVITNEERAEDFYNRITCLVRGWPYVNHDKFTDEQRAEFTRMIPILAQSGHLTVVDDTHNGSHGVTTSLEGIETIFENLLATNTFYDVVIIDYYQNINKSKINPYMSENEVQSKLAIMLDKYKNIYPAPIVIMAQINPPDKKDTTPFQFRIKGRKVIMDPTTLAMEMEPDYENHITRWTIWKSRFTQSIGKSVTTGFEKGKFVEYTPEFRANIDKYKQRLENKKVNDVLDKTEKETKND
jgi:hypothetical protein